MLMRVFDKLVREISKLDSRWYVRYLRSKGCKIGHGTKFHGRKNVDLTRPMLVEIGNQVTITDDVIILTHAHDWSVLRNYYHDPMIIGSCGKVRIGNNIFIGTRSTILMGVQIGDNSIVAAGSVVTRDVEPNTVVAGVPARTIMSLEQHYQRRKERVANECLEYAQSLLANKPLVSEEDFWEFFPLFKCRDDKLTEKQLIQLSVAKDKYLETHPVWPGLPELLAETDKINSQNERDAA